MNEGETFGTATGGAMPPQNGNSFDRPTGAISSGATGVAGAAGVGVTGTTASTIAGAANGTAMPMSNMALSTGAAPTTDISAETGNIPTISTAGVSNSSRFFGGRSRFSRHNAANAVSPQQANYAAAQNIAANPNTPQFFSDAVVASTPVPPAPKRKSKKGLFIGIGAVVIVAVVAVVAGVLMKNGGTDSGMQGEQLYQLAELIDNSRDSVEYFETIHSAASDMEYSLGSNLVGHDKNDFEKMIKQTEDSLSVIKELCDELSKYDIKSTEVDDNGKSIGDYVADLEEVLGDRMEPYENYSVFLSAIWQTISPSGDIEKIQTAKSILSDNDYSAIRESIEVYLEKEKELKEKYSKDGCGGYVSNNVCYNELIMQSQLDDMLDDDASISRILYSMSSKASSHEKPLAIMNKIKQLIAKKEQGQND